MDRLPSGGRVDNAGASNDPVAKETVEAPDYTPQIKASKNRHSSSDEGSAPKDSGLTVRSVDKPVTVDPLTGIQQLAAIPHNDRVRLMVDGYLFSIEGGWQAFEARQPGCLYKISQAWVEGLKWMLRGKGELVFSNDFLRQMHNIIAMPCSEGELMFSPGIFMAEQKAISGMEFSLIWSCGETYHTDAGLQEAIKYRQEHCKRLGIEYIPPFHANKIDGGDRIPLTVETMCKLLKPVPYEFEEMGTVEAWKQALRSRIIELSDDGLLAEEVEKMLVDALNTGNYKRLVCWGTLPAKYHLPLLDEVFKEFTGALKQASTENQVLDVLAEHLAQLQQIHPFYDCNGRLFQLLANLVVMSKGMPPMMFENPSQTCFYDKERLKEVFRDSMEKTRNVILHNQPAEADRDLQVHLQPLSLYLDEYSKKFNP